MRYHLILGNQAYSSWSLRGWLLLKPFGIEFDHRVVPLYVPEYAQFVDANFPAATVPTPFCATSLTHTVASGLICFRS